MEYIGLVVRGTIPNYEYQMTDIADAIKHLNQTNPKSVGTTLVLVIPKLTSMPSKSTKTTSRSIKTMETQDELFGNQCLTLICFVEDFLARLFLLLGNEEDLKILEELYSMKLPKVQGLKDLNYCSWKTSKDFCHTITGEPLELSLQPFLTWGIFSNGRYLTARTMESHRTGNECSLSDILEKDVDSKYFLSEKSVQFLIRRTADNKEKGRGFAAQLIPDMEL